MNILIHFLINILIAFLFRLSLIEILLVGLGGVLIDIDHIFYMLFGQKIYSIKKAWKFHKKEFKAMRPHLYIFHFIEIILIIMLIFYHINQYIFLIFFGFLLHWIFDAVKYIYHYKSLKPWIKYYSLVIYSVRYKNRD